MADLLEACSRRRVLGPPPGVGTDARWKATRRAPMANKRQRDGDERPSARRVCPLPYVAGRPWTFESMLSAPLVAGGRAGAAVVPRIDRRQTTALLAQQRQRRRMGTEDIFDDDGMFMFTSSSSDDDDDIVEPVQAGAGGRGVAAAPASGSPAASGPPGQPAAAAAARSQLGSRAWATQRPAPLTLDPSIACEASSSAIARMASTVSQRDVGERHLDGFVGLDKVFCARWLSPSTAVYGTKCGRLATVDVTTSTHATLAQPVHPELAGPASGIDAVYHTSLNARRTALLSSAAQSNQTAVYDLDTMRASMMLDGHSDVVFCSSFLTDGVAVTGGRDGTVCVFNVSPRLSEDQERVLGTFVRRPVLALDASPLKVRALSYDRNRAVLGTLGSEAVLKLWDVARFAETRAVPLTGLHELTCSDVSARLGLFAVGSRDDITLLDPRSSSTLCATSPNVRSGVRTVLFRDTTLVSGGGRGLISFFDLRTMQYLPVARRSARRRDGESAWDERAPVGDALTTTPHDGTDAAPGSGLGLRAGVYALDYDDSGGRLLAVGGPIQSAFSGSYAAVWE